MQNNIMLVMLEGALFVVKDVKNPDSGKVALRNGSWRGLWT